MTPRESDLRAALRDGEGDGVDPSTVVGRALHVRRRRRRTVGAVLGSVAAVAVVAIAVPLAASHTATTRSSSAQMQVGTASSGVPDTLVGPALPVPEPGSSPRSSPPASSPSTAPSASCPDDTPSVPSPRNLSTAGQAELLPPSVATIVVCVYQDAAATVNTKRPSSYVVTGAQAATIAGRLNDSPAPSPTASCPLDLGPTVALVSTGAGGTRTAVGNAGGCGTIATDNAWRNARDVLVSLVDRVPPQPVGPPLKSIGPPPS